MCNLTEREGLASSRQTVSYKQMMNLGNTIQLCQSFISSLTHTNTTPEYYLLDFDTTAPQWARASSFTRILDHTQRRTAFGRTSLDE